MSEARKINSVDDSELVQQAKAGDLKAFEEIVKRHETKIAGVVIGMVGYSQAAEDIGQEVFIRFYKYLKKFREDSSLGTYLTRIAINLSLNELKSRKRRRLFFSDDENEMNNISVTPNESQEAGEERRLLQKAIDSLEPKFKSTLVLRLIEGYSTEETAQYLGIPLGTVLSRLARAQKKLREYLAPYIEEKV